MAVSHSHKSQSMKTEYIFTQIQTSICIIIQSCKIKHLFLVLTSNPTQNESKSNLIQIKINSNKKQSKIATNWLNLNAILIKL